MQKEYQNKQMTSEREKTVNFYDPTVNAYREIPESLAKKYIENLEELKKQLTK